MVDMFRLSLLLTLSAAFKPFVGAQTKAEQPQPAGAAMVTVITNLREEWARHLSLREVDSAIAMYAPTAVFIDPHGAREVGRQSLKKLFSFVVASFDSDLHFEPHTISIAGNVATDTGNFHDNLHQRGDPAGVVIPLSGDYTTRYKQSPDGQWRIIEQAWTLGAAGRP